MSGIYYEYEVNSSLSNEAEYQKQPNRSAHYDTFSLAMQSVIVGYAL